jgi:hypothetical protein
VGRKRLRRCRTWWRARRSARVFPVVTPPWRRSESAVADARSRRRSVTYSRQPGNALRSVSTVLRSCSPSCCFATTVGRAGAWASIWPYIPTGRGGDGVWHRLGEGADCLDAREGVGHDTVGLRVGLEKMFSGPMPGHASARVRPSARQVRGDSQTGSGFKTLDSTLFFSNLSPII